MFQQVGHTKGSVMLSIERGPLHIFQYDGEMCAFVRGHARSLSDRVITACKVGVKDDAHPVRDQRN